MNTNVTSSEGQTAPEGQHARHEYEPSGEVMSSEGVQAQLANALRPVLAAVQQQLTQTAQAQIDAALEPMHEAIRRQVDLLVASSQATLMGEVDRALDSVREDWLEHVERELHPAQMVLDEQIGQTLQPLLKGAPRAAAAGGTAGPEPKVRSIIRWPAF